MIEPTESDRRAAARLGLPLEEVTRIMEVWMQCAAEVSREKQEAKLHEHDNCVSDEPCKVNTYSCHCSAGLRWRRTKPGETYAAHSHK